MGAARVVRRIEPFGLNAFQPQLQARTLRVAPEAHRLRSLDGLGSCLGQAGNRPSLYQFASMNSG